MPKMIVNDDTVTISKMCSVTGEEYSISVPEDNYWRWKNGELIQRVFPDLPAHDREFLMTYTTPAEWLRMFPSDEEE